MHDYLPVQYHAMFSTLRPLRFRHPRTDHAVADHPLSVDIDRRECGET
jgi:hypothetical protein